MGYRWSSVIGLNIYGAGAVLFYPAGELKCHGLFCAAMFIMGSGLATLETSAIPFVATCGPPRWSELRLNLAQSLQAVALVSASLLASCVVFNHHDKHTKSLDTVQFLYLVIARFAVLLALSFYFAHIPEITDADMAE